jgi:hypothetical protein
VPLSPFALPSFDAVRGARVLLATILTASTITTRGAASWLAIRHAAKYARRASVLVRSACSGWRDYRKARTGFGVSRRLVLRTGCMTRRTGRGMNQRKMAIGAPFSGHRDQPTAHIDGPSLLGGEAGRTSRFSVVDGDIDLHRVVDCRATNIERN